MGKVVLEGLVKRYGSAEAVKRIDLAVNQGEFLTLLGPSGCGKSTTLSIIAGFETPTEGRVLLDGVDVTHQPPFRRNVNTVFQNYALFPHMRVFENVAFGLRARRVPPGEIEPRVREALSLVQMQEFADRMPRQLSGGQQQRVALARALVMQPEVLLLDEPLGALDLKLRKQMQVELKRLHEKLGVTFLFVTHDQEEALTMSDRIAVMNQGRIEQLGTPTEIYDRPRTRFVAEFIGETNLVVARVLERGPASTVVEAQGMRLLLTGSVPAGEQIALSVRPERVRIAAGAERGIHVRVTDRIYVGASVKLIGQTPEGASLIAAGAPGSPLTSLMPNETVRLTWHASDCVPLPMGEEGAA